RGSAAPPRPAANSERTAAPCAFLTGSGSLPLALRPQHALPLPARFARPRRSPRSAWQSHAALALHRWRSLPGTLLQGLLGAVPLLGEVDLEPAVAADVTAGGRAVRRREARQDALDVDGAALLGQRGVGRGPVPLGRRGRHLRHAHVAGVPRL